MVRIYLIAGKYVAVRNSSMIAGPLKSLADIRLVATRMLRDGETLVRHESVPVELWDASTVNEVNLNSAWGV